MEGQNITSVQSMTCPAYQCERLRKLKITDIMGYADAIDNKCTDHNWQICHAEYVNSGVQK